MKILRLLAFVLGGLMAVLALGAVALWVALSSFDADELKSQLSRAVRDKHQRELKIDGALTLSLWPQVGLRIERASLSERGSESLFATLDQADAELALWPLFKKALVIDGVSIKGLSATVSRDRTGELNIADFLDPEHSSSEVKFAISSIRLEEAQLAWRDEKTGQHFSLSEASISTGKIGEGAKSTASLIGRLHGPGLDAALTVQSRYHLRPPTTSLGLDNTTLTLSGTLPGTQAASIQIALGKLDFDGTAGKGLAEGLQVGIKGRLGQDHLEARLNAPKISLADAEARSDLISVSLKTLNAPASRSLEAKLALEGARANNSALSLTRIALDANAQQASTSLRTTLASPLTLAFSPARIELSGLAGQVDITDPKKLGRPMRLSVGSNLSVDLDAASARGHLDVRLDETTARLSLKVPHFSPPTIDAELELDQLNIDKYLPPKVPTAKAVAAEDASDALPDLSAPDGLTLITRGHIGSLQAAGIKAHAIKFDLRHEAGVLTLAPFSAELYQGTTTGSLRAVAATGELSVKQQLSNVNLEPFLKDLLQKDPIVGRGSAWLALSAHGATRAQMKKTLSGHVKLSMRDGALKGVNLGRILHDLRAAVKPAPPPPTRAEKTEFSEVSASLHIHRGIARNDDLVFKAPLLRASGSGNIDLPAGTIDYLARVSVVGTSTGQGGKELAELRGLTFPLRIRGPLEAPAMSLDAAEMARQAVKNKLRESAGKSEQSLQEKIKRFFGR